MKRLIVFRSKVNKQFYWHLRASNGKIIATSGEGYLRKAGAIKAAARIKAMDWAGVYLT